MACEQANEPRGLAAVATSHPQEAGFAPLSKLRLLLDSIRFEHTIFALPFAYLGMALAADGLPTLWQFAWITVAMASARTLAMSANRIIDRHLDAQNPRTASRPLAVGQAEAVGDAGDGAGISGRVPVLAAGMLNTLALMLAPVAAIVVVGYSYTKRFTWTSHFILGWADGIAPAGGWIAVTGSLSWEPVLMAFAVAAWIGGFDMLYACQDYDFDRQNGLHSIPQKWGIAAALRWAKVMHVLTAASLLAIGPWMGLGFPYYIGWAIAAGLLVYEHRLVSPNRPFEAEPGVLQRERLHRRDRVRVYVCIHLRGAMGDGLHGSG